MAQTNDKVIVQKLSNPFEVSLFRSLRKAIHEMGWIYNTVKEKRTPFEYKGYLVYRVMENERQQPIRTMNEVKHRINKRIDIAAEELKATMIVESLFGID